MQHNQKRPRVTSFQRPQATPKVTQTKPAAQQLSKAGSLPRRPVAPAVYRPEQKTRIAANAKLPVQQKLKNQPSIRPVKPSVVQAVKFYPNLHPGAVEPIDPNNVFHLNSFAGQYRLHRPQTHGVNVPNQQYNFVRTREGEMLLHNRYRHPSIAEGKQVLYAGEIFFNNGQLQWWSNGSGHYQPDVEDAKQARLPMDQFYSYQQVIKGEHKRKK